VSILHVELFENHGDATLLAKTDAGTVFLTVDFDAEELPCRPELGDCVNIREPGLNFNCSFGCVLWVQIEISSMDRSIRIQSLWR